MKIIKQWIVVHNNHYSILAQTEWGYFVQDFVFGGRFEPCILEKALRLIENAQIVFTEDQRMKNKS